MGVTPFGSELSFEKRRNLLTGVVSFAFRRDRLFRRVEEMASAVGKGFVICLGLPLNPVRGIKTI